MIGRFQQGRASIELNLSPDRQELQPLSSRVGCDSPEFRDPVTAEAGFVRGAHALPLWIPSQEFLSPLCSLAGVGPANLGVSANFGL